MGAKNCPETPRQKMINMMYIVLTAMLALNVAAEVLKAFRVVDSSLMQTLKSVDMQNDQIYSSFDQAYLENPAKVAEWKEKADKVKQQSEEMIVYVSQLKDELVTYSGSKPVNEENPIGSDGFYHVTVPGDTIQISKEDDLNGPSELMITQKKATELKDKVIEYRDFLISQIDEKDGDLMEMISSELATANPKRKRKDEEGPKTWESVHFEDKPLVAVLTLLTKIQIDVQNSEANVVKYLYSEIDAGSFKFNRLEARVFPKSNVVLLGDTYEAEVFLAAEDTTQQPEIIIEGRNAEVSDGRAIYNGKTDKVGTFTWSGLIKYKTPGGGTNHYEFEEEYMVVKPNVTVSATKMNVFYQGLKNPIEVGGSAIPDENLDVRATNGKLTKEGGIYYMQPDQLDPNQTKTKVSVYATVGGERKLIETTAWRVKRVPDPKAQIGGKSGGEIQKEVLGIQDGILAVLEDFDFDFKYTVTQFTVETSAQGGFTNRFPAQGNRFTAEQKNAFKRVNINSYVYIGDIKAKGDDGSVRDLPPISFKIK